jgi:3-deoxy-manno-octulosonate cytidylyltransferase (CMP-KDO synthetase)
MLADRSGKPLIQHVVEQARKAARISRVVVATDDGHIAEAVTRFGGEYVMTRLDHENGTSRVAEALQRLQASGLASDESRFVVNVQGDEPEIEPSLIDLALEALQRPEHANADVSTVAAPFAHDEDPRNPNIVKVVCDTRGRALYFSRALIPFDRDGTSSTPPLKHIGLYVYRAGFLAKYPSLPPTPLERTEKLEQLRILEHGWSIAVAVARHCVNSTGIDTPEQYSAFLARLSAGSPSR